MKKIILCISVLSLLLSSCKKDDEIQESTTCTQKPPTNNTNTSTNKLDPVVNTKVKEVNLKTIANGSQRDMFTQTGDFIKFSFKEGKVVTSDNWDLAIRGRLFLTNGKSKFGEYKLGTYGDKEPDRTKNVQVVTVIDYFEDIKNLDGYVKTDWTMDYQYMSGNTMNTGTDPAINYNSNPDNSKLTGQSWHYTSRNDVDKILLAPVVFIFKTHDGCLAKMKIEKMNRTNTDFNEKEEIEYKIKYYYNPDIKSISLDETK